MLPVLPSAPGDAGERSARVIELGSAPMFENLGRRKAWEQVAEAIREQILTKRLAASHRLPTERDLAEQFGVSRMAVREAIRSLERAGMLSVRKGPKGGIFVAQSYERPVTDSIVNLLAGGGATLENLVEARLLIEPWCAARACELATEEDIAALGAWIVDDPAVGADAMRARNLEFHRGIIRICRNPVLTIVGEAVLGVLSERIRGLTSPDTSRNARARHDEILRAIRRRQAGKAQLLMTQDIRAIGDRFARLSPEARQRMTSELG